MSRETTLSHVVFAAKTRQQPMGRVLIEFRLPSGALLNLESLRPQTVDEALADVQEFLERLREAALAPKEPVVVEGSVET